MTRGPVLLIGRTGQLGAALHPQLSRLGEVVAPTRRELDLASGRARRRVRELAPSLIVNAAALTSLDDAERDPALAMRINADAVAMLAEEARALGAALVHFSTDCVFDGSKPGGYVEEDRPAPINAYGRSKLAGEAAWLGSGCRGLLVRLAWLYASEGRSLYAEILAKSRGGGEVRAMTDRTGVPTPARFAAAQTVALLGSGAQGLFHLAPRGQATWHEFAVAVLREGRIDVPIAPLRSSELALLARRPPCSVLLGGKAERQLDTAYPEWRALLRDEIAATAPLGRRY